jgi:hypothetical protein
MPGSVSVTIDGTKFNTIETVFTMGTKKEATGVPVSKTLKTKVHVWVDVYDDQNCPFASIKKMFDLANIPDRSKFRDMKIEFWKDDRTQDVICSYKFKGWIGKFEVYNPVLGLPKHPMVTDAEKRVYNTVLHMELEPILSQGSYREVTISN